MYREKKQENVSYKWKEFTSKEGYPEMPELLDLEAES